MLKEKAAPAVKLKITPLEFRITTRNGVWGENPLKITPLEFRIQIKNIIFNFYYIEDYSIGV